MPSPDDLLNFQRMRNDQAQRSMPPPPPLPADIKERFPSMADWETQFREWAIVQLGAKIQPV